MRKPSIHHRSGTRKSPELVIGWPATGSDREYRLLVVNAEIYIHIITSKHTTSREATSQILRHDLRNQMVQQRERLSVGSFEKVVNSELDLAMPGLSFWRSSEIDRLPV